jgi:hypothetical protein
LTISCGVPGGEPAAGVAVASSGTISGGASPPERKVTVWKPGGVGNSKMIASPALMVIVRGKNDCRSIWFSSSMPATRTRQTRVPSVRSPSGVVAAGVA